MFGRKKDQIGRAAEEGTRWQPALPKGHTVGKGAPTPRRKDVEARNRRPIVADKSRMSKEERKAHKAEARARSNEAWQKGQQAMRTGDERNMPPAHAGPVRRFGRDMVDARFNLASYFMPLAVLLFVAMLVQRRFPAIALTILLVTYALLLIMLVDTGRAVRRVRVLAEHRFGAEQIPRGFSTQLFSRTFYIRRWRLPRPQVGFGEFPKGGTREDYRVAKAVRRAESRANRATRRDAQE